MSPELPSGPVCVVMILALLGLVLCCGGCLPGEPSGTLIPGSPETDDLALGRLEPARVERVVVYLYPRGMVTADHYEDLARCKQVPITGEEPVHDLVRALSTQGPPVREPGKIVSFGTIHILLRDGTRLYFRYLMDENEVSVDAPPHEPSARNVYYRTELGSWLRRYVFGSGQFENEGDAMRS